MSKYSKTLELLAQKPMRPILEEFQTNRSKEDGLSRGKYYINFEEVATNRAALLNFFSSLEKYGSHYPSGEEGLPYIPYIYAMLRISAGETSHSIFNHLICAIEQGYDDTFILQTSINLLGTLSCFLFPPLPFLKNPSSPKNSLDSILRNVPEGCSHLPATPTFTCILKFWDRFFEGKDWSDQTKRIWQSYKNYKNDSNPKNVRFNLAEQGIAESPWPPSEHFPTLIRNENDIPLRGRISLLTDIEGRKIKFIEMAAYVSEIFTRQPLRRFVHGFCLFDKEIEFWLIDRTGAFSSGLISIEDDEQVLVRAISSYLLMSDEELGLDTTIHRVDGRSMITIANGESGETREIEIDPKPLTHPRKLLSNGTTCFRSLDDKLLVKYSWRKICGKGEIDLLKEALPVKGVINLVASDTIHRFTDNWGNLLALRPKRWYMAIEKQLRDDFDEEESYKTREFSDFELNRVVVSPYGRRLKSCRSVLQFLIVIRDAIMGHQRLYNEKEITHGDISQGNIIIVTPSEEDRSRGMLIDLDNSISLYDEFLSKKLKRFAGTIKYMAFGILLCNAGYRSSLNRGFRYYPNYDLESFFYVFLTGCVEYGRDSDQPMHNLDSWDTDDMGDNVENKRNDMEWKFEDLIKIKFSSSFVDVKELAIELHKILFGISGENFGHAVHQYLLYNEIISAFNRTIGLIEAGKIPNRTWTDKKTAGA
ncbi:BgTH12-01409 [Blumeria graminis f. sp. triticale]|nr:BgTH12-01409 [Blumeria graminis f. sp. triticale]